MSAERCKFVLCRYSPHSILREVLYSSKIGEKRSCGLKARNRKEVYIYTNDNRRWDRELKKLQQRLGKRPEPGGSFPSIEDSERRPRTAEEMEAEAKVFRSVLEQMGEAEGEPIQ